MLLLHSLCPSDSLIVLHLLELHVHTLDQHHILLAVDLEHLALTFSIAARNHLNLFHITVKKCSILCHQTKLD